MAKGKKTCWIEEQIAQKGPEWLTFVNPETIQTIAKRRVFREMVNGFIDYEKFGIYFQDPKFLENIIIAAREELQSNTVVASALTLMDNTYPGYPEVIKNRSKYERKVYVFEILYRHLMMVKDNYYNIGYLNDVAAILHPFNNYDK